MLPIAYTSVHNTLNAFSPKHKTISITEFFSKRKWRKPSLIYM